MLTVVLTGFRMMMTFLFSWGGGGGGNDLTENKAMGPAGLRLFDLVFKWVIVSLSLYM